MSTFKIPVWPMALVSGAYFCFGVFLARVGVRDSSLYLALLCPALALASAGVWFQSRTAGRALFALLVFLSVVGGIALACGEFSLKKLLALSAHLAAAVVLWRWLRVPGSTVPHLDGRQWRMVRRGVGSVFLVLFLVVLGMVFIPWDVEAPKAPELECQELSLAPEANAFTAFEAAGVVVAKVVPALEGTGVDLPALAKSIGGADERWDPALADAVLAANAEAQKRVEAGLACERYAAPRLEKLEVSRPWLQKYKTLALLMSLKSKRAQLAGDHAGAVQAASRGLDFGRKISRDPGCLIDWLVGVACQFIALNRMEEVAADAATPEPVLKELQACLDRWDPQAANDGYVRAMQCEYRFGMNMFRLLESDPKAFLSLSGDSGEGPDGTSKALKAALTYTSYVFKLNMTDRLMTEFYLACIRDGCSPCAKPRRGYGYPTIEIPSSPRGKWAVILGPNSVGRILCSTLLPAMEKTPARKFQVQAQVAALRLKVALRRYELKHGQLPDDLGALVPEFLPELPADPFGGQPFRYSKEGKKLWSVASNLADDGGEMYEGQIMKSYPGYDLVMPLGVRELKPRPVPPPAAE